MSHIPPSSTVAVLDEITQDGGPRDEGDFSAVAMLLVDGAVTGDEAALRAVQDWLRSERARVATPGGRESENEGRLLGLIDVSHWAIERALPVASLARIERSGHAHRFLAALKAEPGLSSQELAVRLGVVETQVSRVGKRLLDDGMVLRRPIGRRKRWELTPKGRRSLHMLDGAATETQVDDIAAGSTGARSIDAQATGRDELAQRALGSAFATLIDTGPVEFERLRHEVAAAADVDMHVADQAVQQLVSSRFIAPRLHRGTVMTLNSRRSSAIGISVCRDRVVGVLTGPLGDDLVGLHRRELPDTDVGTVVDAISSLVEEILDSRHDPSENVVGLGVELAGHVDGRTGTVVFSPELVDSSDYWSNVPLRELVADAVGLPTVVENNANALALWEQLFGSGRKATDFAVVLITQGGVGSGVVVGGTLAHGHEGIAGELGHLVIDPTGEQCRCGNHGCLETFCSIDGIHRLMPGTSGPASAVVDRLAAMSGDDEDLVEAVTKSGKVLGLGLSHMLNLVNPARVVVFGPPALTDTSKDSARLYVDSVNDAVERYSFSFAASHYDLRFTPINETFGPTGAASAVISRLVGRRNRLVAAARRQGTGRLEPEHGSLQLAHRLVSI